MKYYHVNKSKLRCFRCKGPMKEAMSIRGGPSQFWVKCASRNCNTYYNTAVPLDHQYFILKDSSPEVGGFGAYGSGKTFVGYQGDQKHIMITPNGETLIGANTLVQLDNTVRKDFESDFPIDFVKKYNRQKNMIHFVNGHTLYYRHLADVGDIRSYNLSRAHVLEASEVKHEAYVQLSTRLRNDTAIEYELDENDEPVMTYEADTNRLRRKEKLNWIQMYLESNPDAGWIKDDFLMRSGSIYIHYDEKQNYHVNPNEATPNKSTHIVPSKANTHLPKNFIRNLVQGKPRWWVNRYIRGSFDYSEGMVYPHITDAIVEDFEVPVHWPRVVGMDYGLNDNTHFMFGALDLNGEKNNGKPAVFFYTELVTSDASLRQIAEEYKTKMRYDVPSNSLYKPPVMDQRSFSQRTRDGEKKTIGTLLREYGCFFKPAQMDLEARITNTNDFIDNGHIYFFQNGCEHAIEEFKKYKYPERTLQSRTDKQKPVDKDNHGINATEFIVMELPHKLRKLDTQVYAKERLKHKRTKKKPNWDPFESSQQEQYEGFAKFFD